MKTRIRQWLAVPLLGLLLGVGAAVSVSVPADAASVFDGTWTVSHGGEGQLTLNSDGSYTSTCQVREGYSGAQCPDPTGTFARGYGGASTYVTFTGDAGRSVSYRWAGLVSEPSSMAIGGLSGMIIDRGNEFVCSEFFENGYQLARTPMVYIGDNGNIFGVGSDEDLGPRNADNWLFLAETGPNYFVEGHCDDAGGNPGTDAVHVGDIDGQALNAGSRWRARATVQVLDEAGQTVQGATVAADWSRGRSSTCTTGADGTCSLTSRKVRTGVADLDMTVTDVTLSGSTYNSGANTDPDGDSTGTVITVGRP